MNLLKEIVQYKRQQIEYLKGTCSTEYLQSVAHIRKRRPLVSAAIKRAGMGLIAEVKQKSPSAGTIREPFQPDQVARAYQQSGAHAVSVLIDDKYFGGGINDMVAVRESVDLPMLYKEFVVDRWQIWQAASLGASAVLLIAGILTDAELQEFKVLCEEIGMEGLLEVHDEPELRRAVAVDARFIGVNNRDLKTLQVSLDTSFRLIEKAPDRCVFISESGIQKPEDVVRLKAAGYRGVLVGEQLLRQEDIQSAVAELMGGVWVSA